MGALIIPSRLNQQPQQAPQVDWSNPLARALSFAALPGMGFDAGLRVPASPRVPTATLSGIAHNHTGAASIQRHSNQTPNITGDFTILVLLNQIGNDTAYRGLISKADALGNGWWGLYGQGGNLRLTVFGNTDVNLGSISTANRSRALYAAVGTSGGNVTGYQDGVALATVAGPMFSATNPSFVRLGVIRNDATSENFLGEYLFAAIWNRKLTGAEISSVYANPWQLFAAPRRILPLAASGTPGGVTASLGAVLGGVGLASAASAGMTSSLARTLSPATLNVTADMPVSTLLTQALAPVALVGAGALSTNAALAQTLAPTTLAANGTVAQPSAGPGAIQASLNATLAPTALAASTQLALSGRLVRTLDGAALAAAAAFSSAANVGVTLAPATLASDGAVASALQLASMLDAATLSASARLFILDSRPTPPERTVRVAGEVRAYSTPADGRSSSVSSTAGHLPVGAEPRTLH